MITKIKYCHIHDCRLLKERKSKRLYCEYCECKHKETYELYQWRRNTYYGRFRRIGKPKKITIKCKKCKKKLMRHKHE